MRYVDHRLEYRLVIPGNAKSFRSKDAQAYKQEIRITAKKNVSQQFLGREIEVRLDYFYTGRRRPDMDNITKCVLDALSGVAYADDRQVRVASAVAHFLGEIVQINGGPVDLVKPLAHYQRYLFIRIRGTTETSAS